MTQQAEEIRRSGDERPLSGRTVVVTRPEHRSEDLSRRLRGLGARVLEYPTIRLRDPEDPEPLRRAAARLSSYDWLVFTSPAGPRQLARYLDEGRDRSGRTAAIGPSTAEAAREAGFGVEVVPREYRAEALARAIREAAAKEDPGDVGGDPLAGRRILLPRAERARDVLPRQLEAAGARVDEVTAYVTVRPDEEALEGLRREVAEGRVDWLTFTASSTVRHYVELVGTETGGARVAAIGPITAGTARELGLPVDAVAEEYTVEGLARAVAAAARRETAAGEAG